MNKTLIWIITAIITLAVIAFYIPRLALGILIVAIIIIAITFLGELFQQYTAEENESGEISSKRRFLKKTISGIVYTALAITVIYLIVPKPKPKPKIPKIPKILPKKIETE